MTALTEPATSRNYASNCLSKTLTTISHDIYVGFVQVIRSGGASLTLTVLLRFGSHRRK